VKILAVICLLGIASCKATHPVAVPRTQPPVFHVTMVNPCADVSATGTFQGKEYALERPDNAPLYVACYSPLATSDVGKDFSASLDAGTVLHIAVPGVPDAHYAIRAVREVPK